jgi:hypothetical protein
VVDLPPGSQQKIVALDEAGLSVVPPRFSPFIELCRRGAFDDDGNPVDPLETDAADVAGIR